VGATLDGAELDAFNRLNRPGIAGGSIS